MKILCWEHAKNFLFIAQSAIWPWNQAPISLNFVSWIIHLVLSSVDCNEDNFELVKVKLIQQHVLLPLVLSQSSSSTSAWLYFLALHLKHLLAKGTPVTQIPVVFTTPYIMLNWITGMGKKKKKQNRNWHGPQGAKQGKPKPNMFLSTEGKTKNPAHSWENKALK